MRVRAFFASVPRPLPATHERLLIWVAGRGRGPGGGESRRREFSNRVFSNRHLKVKLPKWGGSGGVGWWSPLLDVLGAARDGIGRVRRRQAGSIRNGDDKTLSVPASSPVPTRAPSATADQNRPFVLRSFLLGDCLVAKESSRSRRLWPRPRGGSRRRRATCGGGSRRACAPPPWLLGPRHTHIIHRSECLDIVPENPFEHDHLEGAPFRRS